MTIKDKKSIILTVGNLVQNKGFDLIIKSVKILIDKYGYKDIILIIAGEGRYRKKLEALISHEKLVNNIELIGSMNQKRAKSISLSSI